MEPSCPLGTTRCILQEKFSENHIMNPLLTKFVRSRWLHIGLVLFLRVYGSRQRVGVKIWNGIPSELRKLMKAPFKRKLTYLLLKILETEEMNVDMRYIDLSSFPAFSLTC